MKSFLTEKRFYAAIIFLLFNSKLLSGYQEYIFPISTPDFSNYGTIGLIQNPTSRFAEEGTIAFSWTHNEPYLRGSILAYPFKWLEASYQYVDINNQLYSPVKAFSGNQSLKDKSFDVKFKIFNEKNLLPAIALGFRDIGGTNLFGAEYLTFSKYINNFDITVGIGWGNLNGNSFSNPLVKLSDRFEQGEVQRAVEASSLQIHFFQGRQDILVGLSILFQNSMELD